MKGAGGIYTESKKIYNKAPHKRKLLETDRKYIFDTGEEYKPATVEFNFLDSDKTLEANRGLQAAFIGFDELTHFPEHYFWTIAGNNRSTCGVEPQIKATCNPDPNSWVKDFISWFIDEDGYPIQDRSGVPRYFLRYGDENAYVWGSSKKEVRDKILDRNPRYFKDSLAGASPNDVISSMTFIPATLQDNKDEQFRKDYQKRLANRSKTQRERDLKGNWNIQDVEGDYFKKEHLHIVKPENLPSEFDRKVRTWDLAQTEPSDRNPDPDYTVGSLFGYVRDEDRMYCLDVERFRKNPGDALNRMRDTARKDERIHGQVEHHVERNPGVGSWVIENIARELSGFSVFGHGSTKKKEERAVPVSSAVTNNKVHVKKDPAWNDAVKSELTKFGTSQSNHDDIVDTFSLAHKVLFKQQRNTKRNEGNFQTVASI